MNKSVLVTGGAGFVGSNLAIMLKRAFPHWAVLSLDNLKRRGSELRLPFLREAGVDFVHGDVRCREDLQAVPEYELLLDCSAEPSVLAGTRGSPKYVLETNLAGTVNCLEEARLRNAAVLFVSTSRIFPIARLNEIPFVERQSRYAWNTTAEIPGFSERGIAEEFPLDGARSFYGTSKLACEHLIQEYVDSYQLKAIINRCGVIAGPWQLGKIDQGVVALWVAHHYFQKPLQYIGFGGNGKQVRDLLHVEDLFDLLRLQLESPETWDGRVYNVGGGIEHSVSLLELTQLCESVTGCKIDVASVTETRPVDLRIFITDSRKVQRDFNWRPKRDPGRIVLDVKQWLDRHADLLKPLFTGATGI